MDTGRADDQPEVGEDRFLGQALVGGLRNAEVDHLGNRPTILHGHEDVLWLDVAVDDPFLVCVLDGATNENEEVEPCFR